MKAGMDEGQILAVAQQTLSERRSTPRPTSTRTIEELTTIPSQPVQVFQPNLLL